MTDEQVYAKILKDAKSKGGANTGTDTVHHLRSVSRLLNGRLLSTLVAEHEGCARLLLESCKNPLARKLRIKAVLAALKSGLPHHPAAKLHWGSALEAAEKEEKELREKIRGDLAHLAEVEDGPSQTTLGGYAASLAQALAKIDALDVRSAVTSLDNVKRLRDVHGDGQRDTYKSHVKVVLIYFKAVPVLKETHPEAYKAWADEMAIERKRVLKESRSSAPSNTRQAENYVAMPEWREAHARLQQEEEPHRSLKSSQTLVWVTYACSLPPKRADFGSMKIFHSEPSEVECETHPNHLVLGVSEPKMVIGEFKTSKNRKPIVETLPTEFSRVVEDSIRAHPREYLFVNTSGLPFNATRFSEWCINISRSLFQGKVAGPNLLRHAFCTSLDFNKMTLAERDQMAEQMGHSSAQQEQYRFITLVPTHEYVRNRASVEKVKN